MSNTATPLIRYEGSQVVFERDIDLPEGPVVDVICADTYVYRLPREEYEGTGWMPRSRMTFGMAIDALVDGDRVARRGWNGKGMWLILAPQGFASVAEHGEGGHTALVLNPFIVMRAADGSYVPWLASQTDILAQDWVVVED